MIPSDIVVDRVSVLPKQLVLYTRPRAEQAKLCSVSSTAKAKVVPPAKLDVAPMPAHEAAAVSAPLVRLASDAQAMPSGDRMVAAADSAASPGSAPTYTAAQAHAGAAVYAKNCISCHGANLQGVAGPAIAGKDFLGGAVTNKWTFADLRNIVVQQMPLNNPGTLTPTQYADVLAFILASNCFPATAAPFPESDAPALAAAKVAPPAAPVKAADPALQTCKAP
jgi:mono/diheme cytochrome c family protein